ncbi:E3 ubiquitin-protein ligase RAD18-like isoform X1 [Schistocerca americana]|uniref:E3 ubiquitin-protein ligase RAD18-like isoform X1 n=2 Tax=Schistocerca americana TaxID=7009 RepID=UPI001F4FBAF3|nr:E3 ubiquitin-protein ligase RAD18-like isoform X1 [Schistocerca americana]XP_046996085.1 E3 ubiquitin-protein ligase RAD18-like isoform X1 [Schistocerca americana]XP_046996087.1 E3 ubiquitin-protein ligase RAD18-like isoform X1 [Schistocerca americana]XP_046996088.1 E3 ubiquitin-protein ligase RAD18-like isoform X1 [Schistocerca americana]XP_046996089.1 E3 ubiquitin-protein ligase RAD18-like isoform X1 [Schistocerca americana]XP_046996090.1 E3 ubiquitin-protein ligase RAD18-like isoform X1 
MAAAKWPVEIRGLEQLDRLLRCGICYEYFSTALMTGCSHNYCSLCIRKSLGYKTECPTCMKETFESHLRSNRILDDIVTLYVGFKGTLLPMLLHKHNRLTLNEVPFTSADDADDKLANIKRQVKCIPSEREATIISEEKRNCELFNREIISNPTLKEISDNDLRNVVTPQKIILPSQLAVGRPSTSKSSIKIPAMFTSPKKNVQNTEPALRKVTCPVCNVDIPEKNINFHLDNCLKREEDQVKIREQQHETRKLLKKPVFSLLKQADLKKKLKEHGLNYTGSRETLIKRFERFILLYNTECDSLKPRPVADIIRQLEQEEQEEKKIPAPQKILTFPKNNEKSDDIRREYLKKNKSSFENLIQMAKQRLQQEKPAQLAFSSNTVKVLEDGDQDSFGNNVKRMESGQNILPSNDGESSSTSSITNEVDIKNSSKKCSRKLQYSDDDDDPEEGVQVNWNFPSTSLMNQASHSADHAAKNMCNVVGDNVPVSGTPYSSTVKTPPQYMRNSDIKDSGNDSNTANVQASPVFASRSSVKRVRSDYSEVHASPEMFAEEIQESCTLRNGNASDAESEKSISLLEYDEGGTSFPEQKETPCQFPQEIVSNNVDVTDAPSEEIDLGGSPLHPSSEEYVPYVHQRKSKRRNLHAAEQENFDRVLRKRSKR